MSATTANAIKITAGGIVALAVAVCAYALGAMGWNDTLLSGWLLAAVMILLGAYQVRRRISMLPLGKVALWTGVHLFLGWLSVALFLVHLGMRWPNGLIEVSLAVLFVVTAVSGAVGQWLNRFIPKRLSELDEELLFERLPVFHRQVRETAENLISIAVEGHKDSPLAAHYMEYLQPWFAKLRAHPFRTGAARLRLLQLLKGVEALSRHLASDERALVDELYTLMRKKHELEINYTYQWLLKAWLLIHAPAAFGTIVALFVHAAIAHAFIGF